MNRLVVVTLRTTLIALFLGLLAAQVLTALLGPFPLNEEGVFSIATNAAYAVLVILGIACVQVALVMVWRLLSMVSGGHVFTERALRLMDAITISAAAGTVVAFGYTIHLGISIMLDGLGQFRPDTGFYLSTMLGAPAAFVATGIALVLFLIVLRGLLQTAAAYRSELAEVI